MGGGRTDSSTPVFPARLACFSACTSAACFFSCTSSASSALAAAAFFLLFFPSAGAGWTGAGAVGGSLDELAWASLASLLLLALVAGGAASALGVGASVGSDGGDEVAACFLAAFFFFVFAFPVEDDPPAGEGSGEVTFHRKYSAGGISRADSATEVIEVEDMVTMEAGRG